MKLICKLHDKDCNLVAEHDVTDQIFCAASDNPFPNSKLMSAVVDSREVVFLYQQQAAQ